MKQGLSMSMRKKYNYLVTLMKRIHTLKTWTPHFSPFKNFPICLVNIIPHMWSVRVCVWTWVLNPRNQFADIIEDPLLALNCVGKDKIAGKTHEEQKETIHRAEVIDDFVRNFLVKTGLTKTLNTFEVTCIFSTWWLSSANCEQYKMGNYFTDFPLSQPDWMVWIEREWETERD